MFCFGQDEEMRRSEGAGALAASLRARGMHVEAVLAEGGTVEVEGLLGVQQAVGIVAVAQKVLDGSWRRLRP